MKKPILYIGVGLIALSLVSMLFYSSNPSSKSNQKAAQAIEPKFEKEGFLLIRDALSWDLKKEVEIEIADTDETIEIGMMYRKSMQEDQAMLFIFDRPEPRSFWMRNTYVSLDLVFIDEQQTIVTIHPNAEPLSDTSMPSTKPAQYVLEVKGGFCEKNNIKVGDVIEFNRQGDSV